MYLSLSFARFITTYSANIGTIYDLNIALLWLLLCHFMIIEWYPRIEYGFLPSYNAHASFIHLLKFSAYLNNLWQFDRNVDIYVCWIWLLGNQKFELSDLVFSQT